MKKCFCKKVIHLIVFWMIVCGVLSAFEIETKAKSIKYEMDVISLEQLLAKLNSENVWVDHDIDSYNYKWGEKTGRLIAINLSGYGIKGELDLNAFTELREIDCSANKISSLKINKLNKLQSLNCRKNNISHIKLGKCKDISEILCENNKIKKLKIEKLEKLKTIHYDKDVILFPKDKIRRKKAL